MAVATRQHLDAGEQLDSLRDTIDDISSGVELPRLLSLLLERACTLIGADDGTIGLYEADRDVIRTAAVYNMPTREVGAEMGRGVGLAGAVLERGAPILARYGDLASITLPELADNLVIGMPVRMRGKLIGFFGVGAWPPRRFETSDILALEQFARHAAIAIELAQRYAEERRRTARFALMAKIASIIASGLDLDSLLQRAADAIHEVLAYPNVDIPLIEPDDPRTLVVRVRGGSYKEAITHVDRLPIDRGIMGAAVRERRPQIVNDVATDARYICPPGVKGPRAELAVPILLGHRVLGVVNVEGDAAFDALDVQSLEIVADHLALAITNARKYAKETMRARRLELIARIGQIIATGLDLDDVLSNAAQSIHDLFGYPNVAIPLIDHSGPEPAFVMRAVAGNYRERFAADHRQPARSGIMGAAANARRAIVVNDVHHDPRYIAPPFALDVCAELAVPIMHGAEVLGVVNIESAVAFDDEDALGMRVIADHLALAINNARLFEKAKEAAVLAERQRLARDLHDNITQILSSISLIAQSLVAAWRRDPAEGERRAGRLGELALMAFAEMRALLRELMPPEAPRPEISRSSRALIGIEQLRKHSLPAALSKLLGAMVPDSVSLKMDFAGYSPQALAHEEALFRICQEAVSNVIRHSTARRLTISAAVRREVARLHVVDDGRGIADDAAVGLGLKSMRERAEVCGGTLRIVPRAPHGTIVEAELPRSDRELS